MILSNNETFALLTDFYELTMANGYFKNGMKDKICYFDVFFRRIPDQGGFAICCGLAQIIDYIENLRFTEEDIEYLKKKNIFDEGFLEYLKDFKFTGDIYAVREGTPIFPNEPLLTVRANAIEAQIIETFLLLTLNHQSVIATKSNRIVRSAKGKMVAEFGARRAQGKDAAFFGARSAYIAGCHATSCTLTDKYFNAPASGTMAHAWVQMFDSEYEAFKTYATIYPENLTLLVDTYDVLKSGVPNAIKVFDEVLKPLNIKNCAIRIDSGDLAYLSKKCRKMLDAAGYEHCKITVSNSLDEYIIKELLSNGACIDGFGVGERLITAKSEPVFDGVYKLCAVEDANGNIKPKIKISENTAKIINPHYKKTYRLFERATNKAIADLICLHDEVIDDTQPLEIFDPVDTWKRKTITDFYAVPLQVEIFKNGKLVYNNPNIEDIRKYCLEQVDTLWDEVKRFEFPHKYYVDLSQKLYDCKMDLLKQNSFKH